MRPPSPLIIWLRQNPVASFCSRLASGNISPAICSTVNLSKGMLAFRDRTTQSRQGHMLLVLSPWNPLVSA